MPYAVRIEPVLNGFIAKVGCQTVVFNDIETLAAELVKYYKDPVATEEAYVRNRVNDMSGSTQPSLQQPESPPPPMQQAVPYGAGETASEQRVRR